MTVRDELAGYVALQRLLHRKLALQRAKETPLEQLVALRARFAERHESLATHQRRRETLSKEQADLEKDSEVLLEEWEHFRKQKSMVTNMKQLAAVVSELDHVDAHIKAKGDKLRAVKAELEALAAAIAGLEGESSEERALREQAEEAWGAQRKTAEAELAEVEAALKEVKRQLGEAGFNRFKKLWTSRKPLAVVPMQGDSCSACHAELRPSLVQAVRSAESLPTCDSCRRVLYDPEQFAE